MKPFYKRKQFYNKKYRQPSNFISRSQRGGFVYTSNITPERYGKIKRMLDVYGGWTKTKPLKKPEKLSYYYRQTGVYEERKQRSLKRKSKHIYKIKKGIRKWIKKIK